MWNWKRNAKTFTAALVVLHLSTCAGNTDDEPQDKLSAQFESKMRVSAWTTKGKTGKPIVREKVEQFGAPGAGDIVDCYIVCSSISGPKPVYTQIFHLKTRVYTGSVMYFEDELSRDDMKVTEVSFAPRK